MGLSVSDYNRSDRFGINTISEGLDATHTPTMRINNLLENAVLKPITCKILVRLR